MTIVITLIQIVLAFALLAALGIGLVLTCLPRSLRTFSLYIAPTVGYVAFCFFTIFLAGLTHNALVRLNWIVLSGLLVWSAVSVHAFRADLPSMLRASKWIPLILGLMLLVTFFPALHLGLGYYVGTANPDFFQSLSFHQSLIRLSADFWGSSSGLPLSGPYQGMFPDAFQARFGAVAFSVALEQLSGLPSHVAVMLSIVVFLLCLPLAVYFFCKIILSFDDRTAVLSAMLIAVVAPTSMSFIHAFVGQNSALATFPLAIALIYITLRERSALTGCLAALVLNGIFWLYVAVIPYVLAPFAMYGALKIWKQGVKSLRWWPISIAIVISLTAFIHFCVSAESARLLQDLRSLMSNVAFSPYYTEYLTDEVFQYALGLASYPLSQSFLAKYVAPYLPMAMLLFGLSIATLLGIALAGVYALAVRRWARTVPQDATLLLLALLITYLCVWAYYTFIVRYGYAPFKMSVWLQFLVPPFFSWILLRSWDSIRLEKQSVSKLSAYLIFVLVGPIYIGLNIVSNLDYGFKSYGKDVYGGSLINAYGIAGNKDYPELSDSLGKVIPSGSTVALGFSDSIQNVWTAYYVDQSKNKSTILSHEVIPFEDAHLPNITTRQYVDSLGNTLLDEQRYFNNGQADYYLLAGERNLNRDIVSPSVVGNAIWKNGTFELYSNHDIHDLLTIGRGFYRIEHLNTSDKDWWWPGTFRWSAGGGEVYHLKPSFPGKAHRLEFTAIVGTGVVEGTRTIEVSLNGRVFDEVVVNGAARMRTKSYFPIDGVNRLVLRVKERPISSPRRVGLWNRDLPLRATPINILFSDIHVLNEASAESIPLQAGATIDAKSLITNVNLFNGFDVNGWIRDKAEFSTVLAPNVGGARFEVLVPGSLGFSFPYSVKFVVNGVTLKRSFPAPGVYFEEIDFVVNQSSPTLRVEIVPQMAKLISDGIVGREVLQSIRLSSVTFRTK